MELFNFIPVLQKIQTLPYLLIIIGHTCFMLFKNAGRWNNDSPGFNKDLLTYKTELQNAVPKMHW